MTKAKEIKLTEEVKKQMLLLNPMSRNGTIKYTPLLYRVLPEEVQPWFKLRQLDNKEKEQVQIAMAQSVLDRPSVDSATGESLYKIAEQKRIEYTEILKNTIVDWGNFIDPEELTYIEYDLENIEAIREDILLEIFSEACAITGIVLQ